MRLIIILLLAASFATAGTPDRTAWKKAWYRARRSESQVAFPTNGLVSYWSMDSVSGTTVFDTWGSNDGTAEGTPLFGSSYGKYLNGVNLNGSSQYITANSVALPSVSTVAFWARKDNNTQNSRFVTWGSAAGSVYTIFTNPSGNDDVRVFRDYTTTDGLWVSGSSLTPLTWYHVCVVNSAGGSGGVKIYVNGIESTTEITAPVGTRTGSIDKFYIGQDTLLPRLFDGSIDEIAVFSRALSSNEVYRIGNTNNPVFYTP